MRATTHYGRTCGAAVIERRRGSVDHVVLGTVERYSADEVSKGAPLLRFTPQAMVSGKAGRQLAATLSQNSRRGVESRERHVPAGLPRPHRRCNRRRTRRAERRVK